MAAGDTRVADLVDTVHNEITAQFVVTVFIIEQLVLEKEAAGQSTW